MSIQNIPKDPHWAIITESSQYIPGDERSRTNPGHGYPAHSVTTISYDAFTNEDDWKERIRDLEATRSKTYVAIAARPATVRSEVVVSVNE